MTIFSLRFSQQFKFTIFLLSVQQKEMAFSIFVKYISQISILIAIDNSIRFPYVTITENIGLYNLIELYSRNFLFEISESSLEIEFSMFIEFRKCNLLTNQE